MLLPHVSEQPLLSLVSLPPIAILLVAGTSACSSAASAQRDRAERFLCDSGQRLDVFHGRASTEVRVGERVFRLALKSGSLGRRYTDGEATLIIDGDTAVFVSGDGMSLRRCEALTSGGARSPHPKEV